MKDMIELRDIKKSYAERLVLDIPGLAFDEGGRYAVMGANGSGKTTLLKIIAGILPPDGGRVRVTENAAANRGYMPQSPYIFGFSVLRNVTMALERGERSNGMAMEALKAVGMDAFARAKGKTLSGGEAQRVALARLIALPRKLLILDEPTSSADIAGSGLVEAAILNYCENFGCTLIFSTHSPAQAMRLSGKAVLLHNGLVVEYGVTENVIHHPASRQGRDFLKHWKI